LPEGGALLALAQAVADGGTPDWEEAEESTHPADLPRLRALRSIAEIVRAHRRLDGFRDSWAEEPGAPPRWEHLELLERIGGGAYGDVYRARDPHLDREVALKLLHAGQEPASSGGRSAVEEGRLLAKVRHPHVATVYGADRRGGRVGLWMELIRGRDLRRIVTDNGPFGPREAALVGVDLCRAAAAVHARGILHRDIKAQNVMREEGGRIVLMDFGIGRELQRRPEPGEPPSGTPLYLAPEVLEGAPASVQSDVYSLGVLLFFLVTGTFPVEGRSLDELRRAHREGKRRLLRDARPELPEGLVTVIERALAAEPEARPSSMGQLERALLGALESDTAEIADVPASPGFRRRRWLRVGLGLLLVLALAAGFHGVFYPKALSRLARARDVAGLQGYPQAISVLATAFDLYPPFALGELQLARYQDTLGRYAEATDSSAKAYRLATWAPFRWLISEIDRRRIVGYYHLYRMQYAEARVALEQAAWSDAETPDTEALFQLAMLYANLSLPQQAVEPAQRAAELEPGNALYAAQLAIQLAEAGRAEEALAVVAQSPFEGRGAREHRAWAEGLAHLVADRPELAQHSFEGMLEGEDVFAGIGYRLLSQAFVAQAFGLADGGPDRDLLLRARAAFHRGIDAEERLMRSYDPGFDTERSYTAEKARLLLHLARTEILLGNEEAALAAVAQVVKLPDVPVMLKFLRRAALIYADLRRPDELAGLRQRIREICETAPSALCRGTERQLSAFTHAFEGRLDEARRELEGARSQWGDPLMIASVLGLALDSGDCVTARAAAEDLSSLRGRLLSQGFAGDWLAVQAVAGQGRCRPTLYERVAYPERSQR
jgi:serine/threonine-protein kinase